MSDFIIDNGVLTKYTGPGGDVVLPEEITSVAMFSLPVGNRISSIVMNKAVFQNRNWRLGVRNMGIAVQDNGTWSFYAYVSKLDGDNFLSFVSPGKWHEYDLDLINNGPGFRYSATTRLLGSLGRLTNPVDLTEECKALHTEYLIKNAKKLIPVAENLRCPAIVEAMRDHGIINDKNKKAIAKLLAASGVPEIAAISL